MINETPGFVSSLRDELVSAAQRKIERRKRRQRHTIHGLAIVAVLVLTAGFLQLNAKPSVAGVLDVTRSNGLISVDLKTTTAQPTQIAGELERHGIQANLKEVPVSQNGVGKFVTVGQSGMSTINPSSTYFQHFTVSDKKDQTIDLWYGRAAKPDEPYQKAVNAYEPGEILHCSGTLGRTVREVAPKLTKKALHQQWYGIDGPPIASIDDPKFSDYIISAAVTDKPNSVVVYVAEKPLPLFGTTTDCA